MIDINKVYCGDCLEIMQNIRAKSVDMVLCDLPYNTTQNSWDCAIDLKLLWEQYERIIKDNGAIVLTAQSPFDKILACSNLKLYKYEWIWEKTSATGHLNAKKAPLKAHENILIFYKKQPKYNPQKYKNCPPVHSYTKYQDDGSNYGKTKTGISGGGSTERYPRSVIVFKTDKQKEHFHPTQKPVKLFEYFIKTYTDEGDLVLDNCAGSFTTAIASENLKRNWICIEKEAEYCEVGRQRIEENRKIL